MGKRHTIEYVRQFFKDGGCELLEEEYVNNRTKMKYICSCGNKSYISFSSFKEGHRCNECGTEKRKKQITIKKWEYPITIKRLDHILKKYVNKLF